MKHEKLIRKVVEAAVKGEEGEGRWLKVDAPNVSDKELSLAIMEAHQREIAEGCNCSSADSECPEWKLVGPTGASQQYLDATRRSRKLRTVVLAVAVGVIGFLGWAIPVLISILGLKKK